VVVPVRGFGLVWSSYPEAQAYVGCPLYREERAAQFVAQRFERGVIFWVGGGDFPSYERYAWVLFGDDGTYVKVPWTGAPPTAPPPGSAGPSQPFEPVGSLARIWKDAPRAKERLGLAVEPERSVQGAWQQFSRGWMFWIPWKRGTPEGGQSADLARRDQWIYIIASYEPPPKYGPRNQWLAYLDRFVD
jgi:hypothetical protein